jgi:hypothetical protein
MMAAPSTGQRRPRLLFCSYHNYLDTTSGAALCTRELLELLTARGWPCRVLCGPQTDDGRNRSVGDLFAAHGRATSRLRRAAHRQKRCQEPFPRAAGPANPVQNRQAAETVPDTFCAVSVLRFRGRFHARHVPQAHLVAAGRRRG